MSRNWLRRLFSHGSSPHRRRRQPQRLAFESLERRDLLATLAVDIADPGCDVPGDKLFCEIQEAVDVASAGDKIKVHAGTYQPFVVNKDNLTIREAKGNSDPIIDATGVENGIELNSNGVTLKGLEVQSSRSNGFLVTGDNNTLRGNTASGNGRDGFRLVNGSRNTLTSNTASDNGRDGFSLSAINRGSSDNNTLIGNTASDNGDDGFALLDSENNTLKGNIANNNDGEGFALFGNNRLVGFHVLTSEFAVDATDVPLDAAGLPLTPVTGSFQVTVLTVLNEQTGLQETTDAVIQVDLDGVDGDTTLNDLVASLNAIDGIFAFIQSRRITIFSDWDNLGFAFANDTSGVLAALGLATGDITDDWFRFVGSRDNTLIGNTASGNRGDGFSLWGSHDNTLQGNTASGNRGDGFFLFESSDNTIDGNTASDNDLRGFVLFRSHNNTLHGNTANGNRFGGFVLDDGNNNTLRGNTANGNDNTGFLFWSTNGNTLTGNMASHNGREGFYFVTSDGGTLTGNTASGNGGAGFFLVNSDNNTLRGNTASGNGGAGFFLASSDSNTLRGNTASDNDGDGFSLLRSSNNTLRGNTASDNDGDGFSLAVGPFGRRSDNNTLIANTAFNNARWGFFIEELLANMFDDNKCKRNTLGGSNVPDIC